LTPWAHPKIATALATTSPQARYFLQGIVFIFAPHHSSMYVAHDLCPYPIAAVGPPQTRKN
jgi:hypothetical protein